MIVEFCPACRDPAALRLGHYCPNLCRNRRHCWRAGDPGRADRAVRKRVSLVARHDILRDRYQPARLRLGRAVHRGGDGSLRCAPHNGLVAGGGRRRRRADPARCHILGSSSCCGAWWLGCPPVRRRYGSLHRRALVSRSAGDGCRPPDRGQCRWPADLPADERSPDRLCGWRAMVLIRRGHVLLVVLPLLLLIRDHPQDLGLFAYGEHHRQGLPSRHSGNPVAVAFRALWEGARCAGFLADLGWVFQFVAPRRWD